MALMVSIEHFSRLCHTLNLETDQNAVHYLLALQMFSIVFDMTCDMIELYCQFLQ